MAKKQSKLKKWSDISKYKKFFPISLNNETLFTIEELSQEEFESYMNSIKPEQQKNLDSVNEILNNETNLAQILKKVVKGIDFNGCSDSEIITQMNSFGTNISYQINTALEEVIVNNMVRYLENMSNTIDTLEAIGGIDQKVQKLVAMTKANEDK